MGLLEELKDRADKLDAELLALSGRIMEIERESAEVHTCINALDIAEMDAEDAAEEDGSELFDAITEQVVQDEAAFPVHDEPASEAAEGYAPVVDGFNREGETEAIEAALTHFHGDTSFSDTVTISASAPHAAESDAVKAISLDQMDDAGITDPAASAMARMLTDAQANHVRKGWPL